MHLVDISVLTRQDLGFLFAFLHTKPLLKRGVL